MYFGIIAVACGRAFAMGVRHPTQAAGNVDGCWVCSSFHLQLRGGEPACPRDLAPDSTFRAAGGDVMRPHPIAGWTRYVAWYVNIYIHLPGRLPDVR